MAWDLDGTDDSFDFGDQGSWDLLTAYSSAIWVQPDVTTADGGLIIKNDGGTAEGVWMWQDDIASASGRTDTFTAYIEDANNDGARIEGATGAVSVGTWQHVASTFVANNATGLRLYIDGVEDANSPVTTAGANPCNDTGDHTNVVQVGRANNNIIALNGKLAEAAAWSRTLSAAEIVVLSKGYSPLFFPDGLILYSTLIRLDAPIDLVQGTVSTKNGNPAVFAHPPIIYPAMPYITTAPALVTGYHPTLALTGVGF